MKLYFIPLVCLPCIFIANCLQGTNNWMSFSKDSSIVGKTCPDNKAFTAQNIQSMFVCATMCSKDYTCASFFFSSSTGRCDGCKLVYSNDSGLTDKMEGSLFYKRDVIYSYLGCYDTFCVNNRYLFENDMTVERCAAFCKLTMEKDPQFLLYIGTHCHCGELCENSSPLPEDACNLSCGGNPNQKCGDNRGYYYSAYNYF